MSQNSQNSQNTTKSKLVKINNQIIIGKLLEETDSYIILGKPFNVMQTMNPQTMQPEIALVPLDMVFANIKEEANSVKLKKEQIMYDKDLSDFPVYEENYIAQITGIETIANSGIIS